MAKEVAKRAHVKRPPRVPLGATLTPNPAAPLPEPAKPLEPPAAPPAETWFRSILTDREGNFDTGRILVAVVVIGMIAVSAYDVIVNHREFKAGDFGYGVGAVLVGFGAYLWGDTRRPPQRFGYGGGMGPPSRYDGRGAALDDKWG